MVEKIQLEWFKKRLDISTVIFINIKKSDINEIILLLY